MANTSPLEKVNEGDYITVNIKRFLTAGLVGAIAIGTLALAGPTAEAATATPARPQISCGDLIQEAANLLIANGFRVVSPETPQNIANELVYAAQFWSGEASVEALAIVNELGPVCGNV